MKLRAALITSFVVALAAACGGATETIVDTGTPSTSSGSSGSSGASSGGSSGGACSPANGRYSRGKGGGDPTCCAGLQMQFLKVRFESRLGTATCEDPPGHAEFTCVQGTCGDGICEVGESTLCGCIQDCPSAAPPQAIDAGAPPVIIDAGTSCTTGGPFQRVTGPDPRNPPPCCPGLVEALWKAPLPTRTSMSCGEIKGSQYFSCIKGKCGDGICESGEKHQCGCTADCGP